MDNNSLPIKAKTRREQQVSQTWHRGRYSYLNKLQKTLFERIPIGSAHLKITKERVYNALIAQSTRKAPGPDNMNFRILRMIWIN